MPKPILQSGEPLLHEVMQPMPGGLFGSDELKEMLKDMEEALNQEPDGVALAAPQIGIPYRIFIVRFDRAIPESREEEPSVKTREKPELDPEVGVFINPEFVKSSRRRVEVDEGCLSVRGVYGQTLRHERATIRAYDPKGKVFERGGGGLVAQIYQHETDHLNGILFTDHALSLVKVIKNEDGSESSREIIESKGTPDIRSEIL